MNHELELYNAFIRLKHWVFGDIPAIRGYICNVETKSENRTKASEKATQAPKIVFHKDFIEFNLSSLDEERSFAISKENGNIVKKGRVEKPFKFDLRELPTGYYHLTVFDSLSREVFAFQVK